MKKIILLALTALMVVGCNLNPKDATRIDGVYYSIPVDSCEYIICKGKLRCHKGNCRFCKERDSIEWEKRKKELEESMIRGKSTLKITHKDDATTDTIVIFKYKEN